MRRDVPIARCWTGALAADTAVHKGGVMYIGLGTVLLIIILYLLLR